MASESQLTPMMAQYRRIKSELPKDALLLFRLGDFYEMFFEDGQIGAQLLNVALTRRGVVPMCGIPFHAANAYIGKLLRGGRKVAICDQVEDARPGQLVKREVTQILSPGTHFDERLLTAERNNFVAAAFERTGDDGLGLKDRTAAIGAIGALLQYLTQHLRRDASNLTRLSFYQRSDFLLLDSITLRHLEILEPLHSESPRNTSLFGAQNRTVTPMGS